MTRYAAAVAPQRLGGAGATFNVNVLADAVVTTTTTPRRLCTLKNGDAMATLGNATGDVPGDDKAKLSATTRIGLYSAATPDSKLARLHDSCQRVLWAISQRWVCHQMASRSLIVRGRQMPLCARCFGVLLGLPITLLWAFFVPPWACWCLIAAFFLDGGTQLMDWRESKNWLRLVTGMGLFPSVLTLAWRTLHGA